MEIQELKRLLQSVSIKQSQINELAARRDELLASAAAPGCGCYENIAGSGKAYRSDKIGSAIAKAAAIDEQLAAVFDEYKAAFKTVRELTGRCNDGICIALLRRRYLCGQDWAEVSAALGITKSYAMRLHKKGAGTYGGECSTVLKTY